MLRVGLISDTHGLLRPEAKALMHGCDHIVHCGDVGGQNILDELAALAPLTAVRGNNDRGEWAERLPEAEFIEIGDMRFYVIHDLAQIGIDPAAAGVRVVVSGHSHRPSVKEHGGVLFVNPGSSGPRRFKLPIAAGELSISDGSVSARIVEFPARSATSSASP